MSSSECETPTTFLNGVGASGDSEVGSGKVEADRTQCLGIFA